MRQKNWWLSLALLLLLVSMRPASAGDLAPDLRKLVTASPLSLQPTRVIVQYSRTGVNSGLLGFLYQGVILGTLDLLNGVVMSLPLNLVPVLALDPAVDHISLDLPLRASADHDTDAVGASQVWASPGCRGTGVRVAVLDSGVNAGTGEWSAAGATRLVAFKDFVNNRSAAYDDNGHGTHVAGIVLGGGSASAGEISGTAPGADLVAVKVLGQDGSGRTSDVIKGLDWCVKKRDTYNLKVINLSLGHRPAEGYLKDPLCKAVRRAVNAGIVVVCSAGNSGKDAAGNTQYVGISTPANEPSAITVGALNTFGTPNRDDDAVCSYSSRGPTYHDGLAKPDLVAPGNRIVSVRAPGSYLDSLYPANRVQYSGSAPAPEYYELSGTSMAAPQVAGIAALVLQANPGLPPNAVKGLLMYTAQRLSLHDANGAPLPSTYSVLTQGAGAVNAVGAVELAQQLNPGAAVGSTWLTGAVSGQSTVAGTSFPWSGQVLWQNLWMRGSAVLGVRQALWSGQADWGSQQSWSGGVTANDYWDEPPYPNTGGDGGTMPGGCSMPPSGDGSGGTMPGGCSPPPYNGGMGPGNNTSDPPPPPPSSGDDTQITWSDTGPITGD